MTAAIEPVDDELAAFESGVLGAAPAPEVNRLLKQAAAAYHQEQAAERLLHEAARLAPDHPAVLIGMYRFYFYKGRLSDALDVSLACLNRASHMLEMDADWRRVRSFDAEFGRYEAVVPRFYLFVLKGYAYLQLRLGNIEEGTAAVDQLLLLDPTDKVGAKVLLGVIQRIGVEEDD